MESNNSVGKEEIINLLYKVDRKLFAIGYDSNHEVVMDLRKAIDGISSQPLSPQSSVGVEEIKNLFDKHGFNFDAFEMENEFSAKAIIKAMTEYSSLMNKEKDEKIKELETKVNNQHYQITQVLNDTPFNAAMNYAKQELQQLLSEKEKEIEGHKLALIELSNTIDKTRSQREYWKQRCEAAEAVIHKTNMCANHEKEYSTWAKLKQSPIN